MVQSLTTHYPHDCTEWEATSLGHWDLYSVESQALRRRKQSFEHKALSLFYVNRSYRIWGYILTMKAQKGVGSLQKQQNKFSFLVFFSFGNVGVEGLHWQPFLVTYSKTTADLWIFQWRWQSGGVMEGGRWGLCLALQQRCYCGLSGEGSRNCGKRWGETPRSFNGGIREESGVLASPVPPPPHTQGTSATITSYATLRAYHMLKEPSCT